ncbi:MAG: DUF4339 domain-containing protein [Verrucomicrobia bacterium]|nr:DUF4339 domain-containing protein [Verrucomicrobiota bacterium]
MQIHVARPPNQLGVFSQEEVAAGLQSGRFLPTDQGWREGMSAWTPLSQWAEFSSLTAAAPAAPAEAAVAPSQVPWEQGKSAGSFFATVKAAVFSPRETFANARMEFGDWLIFAYIAQVVVLPVRLLQAFAYKDPSAQMLSFFEKFNNPALEPLLRGLRQNVASADLPIASVMKGVSVFGSIAIGPLMVALFGVIIWVGLWIMRQKVDCGRAIGAMLMASSIASIIVMPFGLLGFNFILLFGLGCLLGIPYMIFYHRLHGAAIQRSAWVSFGAHLLFGLILGCCGFACMAGALGLAR